MKDSDGGKDPNSDTKKRKLEEENIQLPKETSNANSKRPCVDQLSVSPTPRTEACSSHGSQIMTKTIKIPKDMVGLIIGKDDRKNKLEPNSKTKEEQKLIIELIANSDLVHRVKKLVKDIIFEVEFIIGKDGSKNKLELQSKVELHVFKDCEPNSKTRDVELIGNTEQINRAEDFIMELIANSDQEGKLIKDIRNNQVNTSETTNHAQPTCPPPNWFQPSLQQQQPLYVPPGTDPVSQWPPNYSYPTQVGSSDYAYQSTSSYQPPVGGSDYVQIEQSTGNYYYGQQSPVVSAPPYHGYTYAQPASTGFPGYDQSNFPQVSSQIPQYGQQNVYPPSPPPHQSYSMGFPFDHHHHHDHHHHCCHHHHSLGRLDFPNPFDTIRELSFEPIWVQGLPNLFELIWDPRQ